MATRYQQPQSGPLRVDWGNPITKGLVNGFLHPAQSLRGSGNSGALQASPSRKGLVFASASSTQTAVFSGAFSPESTQSTFILLAKRGGLQLDSGFGVSVVVNQVAGVQDPFAHFIKDSGERLRMNTTASDSSANSWETTEDWVVDQWMVGAYTWVSGQEPKIYRDGRALALSITGGVLTGTLKPSTQATINLAAFRLNGAVGGFLSFNRALSALEIKLVSDNPWQIFAPQARSLWAAAGGTTHTLIGASSAQAASSGTGAVTQAHALAGAASAQSASSGTGTIAQVHALTGAASTQGAVSGTGAIAVGGVHALTGAATSQGATSSVASVTQVVAVSRANEWYGYLKSYEQLNKPKRKYKANEPQIIAPTAKPEEIAQPDNRPLLAQQMLAALRTKALKEGAQASHAFIERLRLNTQIEAKRIEARRAANEQDEEDALMLLFS